MTTDNLEIHEDIPCEDEEEEKRKGILQESILLLNKYNLRNQDLVLFYAELGFSIGSSIEGYTPETLPTVDELQKSYYEKPSMGKALMLQSLLLESWKRENEK